ncbi:MAG: thioredoxin domain-containing protein, partial [Candidatus Helarchaeota archaeon]
FSGAPKFPTPHNLLFLLRYWKRTGAEKALKMAEKTLQAMRAGGIFDHIGYGFHRYSTDFFWLLPHFEKMLYDQALLAIAYVEAFQATKRPIFKKTTQEILTYIMRDMTSPEGAFYSAEDADSENAEGQMEEGAFYLWKEVDIANILGEDDAGIIFKIYNTKKGGNYLEQTTQQRTGKNILHLTKSLEEWASDLGIPIGELEEKVAKSRKKLFAARERRPHPHKDDKVLTSWNGLMIAAFAKAGRILNEPQYISAAENALQFIDTYMKGEDNRLLHRYRDGEAAFTATLDDYAFLIWGLLETYESTFDAKYLAKALVMTEELITHFWDSTRGGFYFTAMDGEELLLRQKEIYDGAIPSGNSVAMLNLLRMGEITGKARFTEYASQLGRAFANQVIQSPSAFTFLMVGLEFVVGNLYQVVIAGNPESEDTISMIKAVRAEYLPNKTVILNPINEKNPIIFQFAEHLRSQPSINGKATAYICLNKYCNRPVTAVPDLLELLN